jgi:hypothetical protein
MWVRGIAGLVMCVVGAIWILQGAGVLKGSFMTRQSQYTVLGAIVLAVGLGLVVWAARVRQRSLKGAN